MSVGTVAGARVSRRGAKARERRVQALAVSGAVVVHHVDLLALPPDEVA